MTPPRINSKDMAASQPVTGIEIEAGAGEKAEAESQKQNIEHNRSPCRRHPPDHTERAHVDRPELLTGALKIETDFVLRA